MRLRDRLPDDDYATYPARTAQVALDAANAEARALFGKRPLTWVVVGDRTKIESGIRTLGLGEVRVIDADGEPSR